MGAVHLPSPIQPEKTDLDMFPLLKAFPPGLGGRGLEMACFLVMGYRCAFPYAAGTPRDGQSWEGALSPRGKGGSI